MYITCAETAANGRYAFFCRADPEREAHWRALTEHFSVAPLPECLVSWDYQAQGIWIRGAWRPLVKMPWVRGADIHSYIEKNLNDVAGTARLAEEWRTVVLRLKSESFVHGDIQHGNLLVEEGTGNPRGVGGLRLIDYDSSLVAGQYGLPLRERGHPSYQHPLVLTGKSMLGNPFLDRFPALVVYTALRVLAVAPEVWYRLDNGENLLFRREDFADPAQSRAFAVLTSALGKRPAERRLLDLLRDALAQPLPQSPLPERWPLPSV